MFGIGMETVSNGFGLVLQTTFHRAKAAVLMKEARPTTSAVMSTTITKPEKKRVNRIDAWRDARELIWSHRYRLALGMLLMVVNRLVGLVLPASSKYLIDDVIIKHRSELLVPLALAAGGATMVQAVSSFALSQVLGVAAQRAITEMRKSVQEHIARLPIRYFASTQTGILISRIMTDAEGIRNLVGTG